MGGKIAINPKAELTEETLELLYTPAVGLGDQGPLPSLPVLEGKALLFRALAGIDAVPVALWVDGVDGFVAAAVNRRARAARGGALISTAPDSEAPFAMKPSGASVRRPG